MPGGGTRGTKMARTPPPNFARAVLSSGIVDRVLAWARFKATTDLQKATGTKRGASKFLGLPKLDDANHAGTSKGPVSTALPTARLKSEPPLHHMCAVLQDCTLILTEGDSAKSLAIAGLSVVGRDYYGGGCETKVVLERLIHISNPRALSLSAQGKAPQRARSVAQADHGKCRNPKHRKNHGVSSRHARAILVPYHTHTTSTPSPLRH